jgi:hydroxymethylpyrimidine pyrophosphatase-like HAD family hydrolase
MSGNVTGRRTIERGRVGEIRYQALATDYDGTIAHDGVVDDDTVAALERVKASGLRLLLVTGRELDDLANTFAHMHLFDRIVAENGAVLLDPADGRVRALAGAPPAPLIAALRSAKVPISVGHSIVATVVDYETQVLAAIREAGLDWQVIHNKESVMLLPAGVDKATGLAEALRDLDVAARLTVAVGDAENDDAFLSASGLGVAVNNALPSLKAVADLVTDGACGDGVAELIAQLLSGALDPAEAKGSRV